MAGVALVTALLLSGCGSGAGDREVTGTDRDPTTEATPTTQRATTANSAPPPSRPEPPPTSVPTPPAPRPAPEPSEVADPVRVRIPRIGVDAPVIRLGLDTAGALEVPTVFSETGWWADGPEPGEAGPAVIVGHVDSRIGPAVFYRLDELRAGDRIEVARADGSTAAFVVQRSEQHPKRAFPTEAVYGPVDHASLRLVTCGGEFDRSSRHYLDNVIVFARVGPR
jgi:sortase (surface protein transpeptidase)